MKKSETKMHHRDLNSKLSSKDYELEEDMMKMIHEFQRKIGKDSRMEI